MLDQTNSSALIIMAKKPKVGSIKTRLCPPLKLDEAAMLYEALLWDTIEMVTGVRDIDLAIAITPPESSEYFKQITPLDTILIPVACADIGECLACVLGKLIDMGYDRVMALNSDGPTLPPGYIQAAIQSLEQHDLVLGPAEDGGYYLVGFQELHTKIFSGIDWSTDRVLTQTLRRAEQLSLSVHLLPPWYDIDTVADIHRLRDELKNLPPNALTHTRRFLDQWLEKI
jgi:rSAM/selenodomain-associated transferase 1